MSYVTPPFISERQAGAWVDCVDCSALMAVLAHSPEKAPATLSEAKALRSAAGFPATGGTSIDPMVLASGKTAIGMAAGVKARYAIAPAVVGGSFATFWSALTPGRVAFAIIKPSNALSTSPIRRYQGTFDGLHGVYLERLDSTDRVWFMDPCGPTDGTYKGAWVTKADLAAAYVGDAAVLAAKVKTTSKRLVCPAAARPNATFGAAIGKALPGGTVIGVTGSVTGSLWTRPATCNTGVSRTGRKWYVAATINGKPVSSVYPGHALVWVYAGAIAGG